jgi:hypothetical protein
MLKKVDTVKTACSQYELTKGFIEGWKKQFGILPQKKSIAILYAQNSIETGGTTHMWNWNLGNIKVIDDPNNTIEYCALNGVWEIINGQRIVIPPDNPGAWFRSFPTLADGIAFQLDFLKNKRYKKAFLAIENGNPVEFAHLLKMAGYYTASEADYAKAVGIYFNKFMKDDSFEKIVISLQASEPEEIVPETIIQSVEPTTVPVDPVEVVTVVPIVSNPPRSPWSNIVQFFSGLFNK